jgi:Flp pilus assembly protein TadD
LVERMNARGKYCWTKVSWLWLLWLGLNHGWGIADPAVPPPALREGLQVETQAGSNHPWHTVTVWPEKLASDYGVKVGPTGHALMHLNTNVQGKIFGPFEGRLVWSTNEYLLSIGVGRYYHSSREIKPLERLRFRVPGGDAALLGTDINLEVDEHGRTVITVVEGSAIITNAWGLIQATNGESLMVAPGQTPQKSPQLKVIDQIQWVLYYPSVLQDRDVGEDLSQKTQWYDSVMLYRAGDTYGALQAIPSGVVPTNRAEALYYGALLLSAGRVRQAETFWTERPQDQPGVAQALGYLVNLVQGREQQLVLSNQSATECMARSYALQKQRDLKGARLAVQEALTRSPDWGYGWIRLAELDFAHGDHHAARTAIDRGLRYAPKNAAGWALLGYVEAAEGKYDRARLAFENAIELDGLLGEGWLGRGLIKLHQGRIEEGLWDLQTAVAAEPQRALLRAYLAKAFAVAGNPSAAAKELDFAKATDPLDPTPWLYSSLILFQANRLNEAINDLETSKQLNQQRQLYRSRLLLDQDQAVRSANLAAMYRDAGLSDFALKEAGRAVSDDYANASAHAFLANAYDALRDPHLVNNRYETPWHNELLLANLLAPPGVGNLSQNISLQEYSRLFDRNHLGLLSSTEYNSQGDWRQSASQYGNYDRVSYAVDVLYRSENGQRINEDLEDTEWYAKTKLQFTPQDSLLFMASTLNYDAGDLRQYYDPRSANPCLRVSEHQEPNLYVGYHHEWQPGMHSLLLLSRLDDTLNYRNPAASALVFDHDSELGLLPTVVPDPASESLSLPFAVQYRREITAWSTELQQFWQTDTHTLIGGVRYQIASPEAQVTTQTPERSLYFAGEVFQQSIAADLNRVTGYLYDRWQVLRSLQLHAGITYDYISYPVNLEAVPLRDGQNDADQFSPKAGLIWNLATNTYLAAAWTRSLGGAYHDQSLRLEPSQVAGFTQAYRSLIPESAPGAAGGLLPAAKFETWGLRFDQRLWTHTYFTLEGNWLQETAQREVGIYDFTWVDPVLLSHTQQKFDYDEQGLTATLNQLIDRDWAIGISYRANLANLTTRLPALTAADLAQANYPLETNGDALLQVLRLFISWNHPSGLFGRFDAHWHHQNEGGSFAATMNDSDFWQLDVWLGQRLFHRRATLQLGLLNLTGQDYRLNPINLYQELPRTLQFTAQFQWSF